MGRGAFIWSNPQNLRIDPLSVRRGRPCQGRCTVPIPGLALLQGGQDSDDEIAGPVDPSAVDWGFQKTR
jgi:hypothetical protein